MTANLSPRARLAVYVVTGVMSAVVAYLVSKDIIGDAEVTLWAAIAALVNGLAALNTPAELSAGKRRKIAVEQAERNQRGEVDLLYALLVILVIVAILVLVGVL